MHTIDVVGKVCQNHEAHAIGSNMPKLCHLEIGYMLIKTMAVVKIAFQCLELKFLDLRGCWDVDDTLLQEKNPWLKSLGPRMGDCYENHICKECTDDSGDEYIYSWEQFMDDVRLPNAVLMTSMNFCVSKCSRNLSHGCNPP